MQLEEQINRIKRRMDVARKQAKADLVIRNAKLVNVFLKSVQPRDVAVADGIVAGVYPAGEGPEAEREVDAKGKYLIPGLIDAHTHVEMAYVSAVPFAEGVLPWGTTTVILDPHDSSNVMGNRGVELLAREFLKTPLKVVLMTPPCVPSAPAFEDAGFEVTLDSLIESRNIPLIKGIAETMDFTRVLSQEEEMMKILAYGRENGLLFDGHAPEVRGLDAQAYFGTGPIRTDHESVTVDEMYEKYEMGVHVVIRRGSLAEPASAGELLRRLEGADTSRLLLATDGCINVSDMVHKGHMNYALRQIVAEGVDPMTAVQMATINVARAHHIDHRVGAVAPGYEADLVLVNDLKDFETVQVFVNGQEIPRGIKLERVAYPADALHSVKINPLKPQDLRIEADGETARVRVLTVIDKTVATVLEEETLPVNGGALYSDTDKDVLKGLTLERYGRGKGFGLGFIRGYGMKKGAIAGSIGQDTQNITAVGVTDEDLCLAINEVAAMQGGVVLVADGKVRARIAMPILGIMSDKPFTELEGDFQAFHRAYCDLGGTLSDEVFTLSLLLSLVVIPEGGLSNRGLVDVTNGRFVDLIVK